MRCPRRSCSASFWRSTSRVMILEVASRMTRAGPRDFAADGFKELFARNGRSAALHHHQATGNVGDVRRFERRCTAGERQSIRGKNRIASAGDINGLIAAVNGNLCEAITSFEKSRAVPPPCDEKRLQFHRGKSRAACSCKLTDILTDDRVMFGLKLGLVRRGGSDSSLRIAVQSIARVECDVQLVLAFRTCLPDKLRSRNTKSIIGNRQRVGFAQIRGKSLMNLFSNGIGQR